MAVTTGLVHKAFIWGPDPTIPSNAYPFGCFWIGPAVANAEILFVRRYANDSAAVGAFKHSMIDALVTAMSDGLEVDAHHGDTDALITYIEIQSP